MATSSGQKAHNDTMREAALQLLLEAGAIAECEHDPGIYLDQHAGTEGARTLGLKMIKLKDRRISSIKSKQDLGVAIEMAMEDVEQTCSLCARRAKA